jgi:hypothetical protein
MRVLKNKSKYLMAKVEYKSTEKEGDFTQEMLDLCHKYGMAPKTGQVVAVSLNPNLLRVVRVLEE